jgi:hypothetical protein
LGGNDPADRAASSAADLGQYRFGLPVQSRSGALRAMKNLWSSELAI